MNWYFQVDIESEGLRLLYTSSLVRVMSRVNVTKSRPQDWAYLSEGGSTIVFTYTGSIHPDFSGKVLRLRKAQSPLNRPSLDRTVEEEDDPVIAFQHAVIAPLVPSEFLPDLDVVLLDTEWLTDLEVLCDSARPTERRAKDRIDKSRQKGILATDLVGGADILAIEIKPKWGFMPNPAYLSGETAAIKTSTCRFCIHTRSKSKDGGFLSRYCPLDLYSNDETRKRKAIRGLWDGWVQSDGTLNNMKIFVSGEMIKPSESYSSLVKFLSPNTGIYETLETAMLALLRAPALKIISNLQRSLDALDIEGIAKLYAEAYPNTTGLGTVTLNPSLEEWRGFVDSYRTAYCTWDHSRLRPENIDTYLMAYMLSATFKDCSVILRMHQSTVRGESSVDPYGIFIIDLDIKGADRFERWIQLDRRIVECYRDMADSKFCIEEPA